MSYVSDLSNLEGANFKSFFILIPFTNSLPSGVGQIMKFALLNVLRWAYFEARFVKNWSIFEPRIEKHYAYKKTCQLHFKLCTFVHPMKIHMRWESHELQRTLRHLPWPKAATIKMWRENACECKVLGQMNIFLPRNSVIIVHKVPMSVKFLN